jgi:OmpA-OmpF porin, OOP family
MSINLLDLVKTQLTSSIITQTSKFLGESENGTQNALAAALPAVLGGIVNKVSTNDGAKNLMDLLLQGKHDGSLLDNFSNIIGNSSQTQGLIQSGNGLLKALVGDKVSGIVNVISSISGISSGSISSLLGIITPLFMGTIGRQVSTNNLGLSGLTSLLSSQIPFIKETLPATLGSVLGFGDFGASVIKRINQVEKDTKSPTNWVPWIVGGALILGGFLFFKSCQGQSPVSATSATAEAAAATETAVAKAKMDAEAATKATADKAKELAKNAMELFKVSLPSGETLDVPKGSLEDTLVTWLNDKTKKVDKTTWFNFDRLLFDTGKSTLQASSQAQLANVAAILKSYPTVKIKLGGYTDNTGNAAANLKLSSGRAAAVYGELLKLGAGNGRIAYEGYGAKFPIGDNNSEEGRQQNRRIAIRVTAK